MSEQLEPIEAKVFSEEQIETALLALAVNGGRFQRACEELAANGFDVKADTLRSWKIKYPARYQRHCVDSLSKIEERAVGRYQEIIAQAQDALQDAVTEEHKRIRRGDVRDTAASARNLATIAAIGTDKALVLSGRPNVISEARRPEDIIRRLKELGVDFDAEGSVSPSEVAPPSDPSVPQW